MVDRRSIQCKVSNAIGYIFAGAYINVLGILEINIYLCLCNERIILFEYVIRLNLYSNVNDGATIIVKSLQLT